MAIGNEDWAVSKGSDSGPNPPATTCGADGFRRASFNTIILEWQISAGKHLKSVGSKRLRDQSCYGFGRHTGITQTKSQRDTQCLQSPAQTNACVNPVVRRNWLMMLLRRKNNG